MAALSRWRPAADRPLSGTGRVTLARTGGAAPGWGAYALLYTTRWTGGALEAVIAATAPEDTDPAWGLQHPRPYGPVTSETRPLMAYAEAAETPRTREPAAAHEHRLAVHLLRTGYAARLAGTRGCVNLPAARWEVDVAHTIPLATNSAPTGFAGHTRVLIGRLLSVTDTAKKPTRSTDQLVDDDRPHT